MCECQCKAESLSDEELIKRFKEVDALTDTYGKEILKRGFKMTFISTGNDVEFDPVKITKEITTTQEF